MSGADIGARVLVRTPEVRGPGVVTEVSDHWKYIRVLLDSGHRATVHAHEFEVIGEDRADERA